MLAPSIQISTASLFYGEKAVFSNLTLHIPAKKWTALLGPSGIGKSSLLRMLAGLTLPEEKSSGNIMASNNLPITNQIAYMAQSDLLLPWLSVLDNATLGLKLRSHTQDEYKTQTKQAQSLLEQVGLSEAIHLYPHQLSGGMRQRVALVRTLMEHKPIILMDEPFSALDTMTRYKLQALAAQLLKDKTVLFITHDPAEALRLAHEVYVMQGNPVTLTQIENPASPTPREPSDPDVIRLHAALLKELTQSTSDIL